ncbi:MAG: hypothetical protein WCL71_07230 [Deltaproteobacteria bacterium]
MGFSEYDDVDTWVAALNSTDSKLSLFDGDALIEPGSDGEFHLFVLNENSGTHDEVETDHTPYGVVSTVLLMPVTRELASYLAPEKINYWGC